MIRGLVMACALLVGGDAYAQAVKDKPQIALDAAKAYIYFSGNSGGQALMLVRQPTAHDLAVYKARRDEALGKAQKKYASALSQWQTASAASVKSPKTAPVPGTKPVEPNDANFVFPPIEPELAVSIGPFQRFSKGDGASTYLHAVIPGTYTVYGPVTDPGQGLFVGTCLCMGSVKFVATMGVITDLGRTAPGTISAIDGMSSFSIMPPGSGRKLDSRLATFPTVSADYHAAGKMPNWFGLLIDRIAAMPGVIDYDHDKVIDAKTGLAPGVVAKP